MKKRKMKQQTMLVQFLHYVSIAKKMGLKQIDARELIELMEVSLEKEKDHLRQAWVNGCISKDSTFEDYFNETYSNGKKK
jgi:hypothetical protein